MWFSLESPFLIILSDIFSPTRMTSHSKVNSFTRLWLYKKFVGLLHGNQITLSWLVQFKTIKFWPRKMLPALAGGDQPGLGCGLREKEEGGLWFRDLLMTAGSATDRVGTRQLLGFLRPLPDPLTPLCNCSCTIDSGISTCCLAGKHSPFTSALALSSLFSHHLGFRQCT